MYYLSFFAKRVEFLKSLLNYTLFRMVFTNLHCKYEWVNLTRLQHCSPMHSSSMYYRDHGLQRSLCDVCRRGQQPAIQYDTLAMITMISPSTYLRLAEKRHIFFAISHKTKCFRSADNHLQLHATAATACGAGNRYTIRMANQLIHDQF